MMSASQTFVQWLIALVYMNCVDSHRRVDEGITVGNCIMNRLLFAD